MPKIRKMAQFFVVALFVFAVLIFIFDRWRAKVSRGQNFKSDFMDHKKVKQKNDRNWLDLIPGPKPFPLHLIGNAFQVQPVSSKLCTNFVSSFPSKTLKKVLIT